MHLVNSNVEKIQLEISELENKPLNEERVSVRVLSLVVLDIGGPLSNLAELLIDHHCCDSLSDRCNHIHVTVGVKERAFIREMGQTGNVKDTAVMLGSDHTGAVQEANDHEDTGHKTRQADSEGKGVERHTLIKREVNIGLVGHLGDDGIANELLACVHVGI